jgi:DNA-binding MarR family transcriptional regulator
LDVDLPQYLPVVGYGLFAEAPPATASPPAEPAPRLDLSALLAQVLLAFTLEFERESPVSLAIAANALRVLNEEGVRLRDIPRLAGVSKEAVSMSAGFLEKRGDAAVQPDPAAARGKVVRLTPKGARSQAASGRLIEVIEERWAERFGLDVIRDVRTSLEPLAGFAGPEPYPDGWRAARPRPETLPHHPAVLHRGGFPDGS